MKILLIADHEEKALWDDWNDRTARELSDVGLILSAGDLDADYLEFLVTMLNVPLVYVRGNHDGSYDKKPPEGCINADGRIVDVQCGKRGAKQTVRILGLGGSMRYRDNAGDMYTEREMKSRVAKLKKGMFRDTVAGRLDRGRRGEIDILLTHAPCRGYGDMSDVAHTGFECFDQLIRKHRPRLHVYGHVHLEYGPDRGGSEGGFSRMITHPAGTQMINASGYYITEL